MRPSSLLLFPLVLALGPAASPLGTDYTRERTLRLEARSELDLETTTSEMQVDGQPVDRPGSGASSSLIRRATLGYQILAGTADGPTHVRLAFDEVGEESQVAFGDEERRDERPGPLDGVVLEITVDEEGRTACERVEGPAPDDEALLEGHAPTLFLDAFLPEEAVEEGASWDLDHAAVRRGLAAALDARLFPVPERGDSADRGEGERGQGRRRGRGGRGGSGRTLDLVEWSGTATLAEASVDHEGVPCARIHLELEGQAELPEPDFGGGGRPRRERAFEPRSGRGPVPVAGALTAELEGDLFVALESQAPRALELDGELEIENRFEGERGGRSFSSHSVQSGRWSVVVSVEESAR